MHTSNSKRTRPLSLSRGEQLMPPLYPRAFKSVLTLTLVFALLVLLLTSCAVMQPSMPPVSVADCPKPPPVAKSVLDPPAPSPGSFSAALQEKVKDWQIKATSWQTNYESVKPILK